MHKNNQSIEQQQQEQQRLKQQSEEQEQEQLLQALSGRIDANSCGSDEPFNKEFDKKTDGPNKPSV